MLNKDQYNQDEYNDYYAQETKGAEISATREESNGAKIGIIIALLLALGGGGFFAWKSMNKDQGDNSTLASTQNSAINKPSTTAVESTPQAKETETQEATSSEEETAKAVVQSIASSQESKGIGQMSPEDMAKIVQMVTQQMRAQQAQHQESISQSEPEDPNSLEASLQNAEVDSLTSATPEKISSNDNQKQATTTEKPNTYNKVVVSSSSSAIDDLSKLSDEISNVINEEESTTTTNSDYTKSLKNEVETRAKEMRYVTVKKGDTLGKIAQRIYGNVMDYKKIYEANPDILRRADKIYIGQRLRVPE